MENRIGQQLGNYRLSHLLGAGGFGNVYLARHIHLGTQAAIKILTTKMTEDEIGHFRDEARTTMNLQHPNILQVLDFGIQDGIVFIVMRYAPNGTLRHRHPKGTRLSPDTIITYVKQVASALQYAHDQRIIHRDVKPENMLLGRNDEVLLSDFGIATIAHDTTSQSTQDSIGTPSYMAPEQVKGKPSPASDQYALGVTVYEWLCGNPPFQGSSPIEIVVQHISVSPPPLHEKVPEISPTVEQIVLKALAKDPHQRFTSVQEFANALEQAFLGQPFDEPIQSIATGDSPPLQEEPATSPSDTVKGFPLQVQPAQPTVSKTFGPQWRPRTQPIGTWVGEDVFPGPPTVMVASVALSNSELKDFFISYNSTNFAWAAWIDQQLGEAGYSTLLPPWGLRLDSDFELEMQKAAAKAKRIIAVLSPAYLNILNTQPAWIETFKLNTAIEPNTLIPIRVQECGRKFRKLLESINHIDIIGRDEETAQAMLLAGIHGQGVKLTVKVSFPASAPYQPSGKGAGSPKKRITTRHEPTGKAADKTTTEYRPPIANLVYTATTLIQQIEIASTKKDWPDVIRKVNLLKEQNPLTIPPRIYHLQGLAFQEEGDLQNAYKALHTALALTSEDNERLLLLNDCTTMLIALAQWSEVLNLTKEALRLSPNNFIWIERKKQALDQLQGSRKKGITIFFSYSHKDERLRDTLDKFLRPLQHEGLITSWHDGKIEPGKEWTKEIEEHLSTASIILLLVSSNFLDSDYCYSIEMKRAIARHEAGEARVIPVILSHADWHNAPFGKLQALPRNARAVTDWSQRDKAFLDIVTGIRKAVEELSNKQ